MQNFIFRFKDHNLALQFLLDENVPNQLEIAKRLAASDHKRPFFMKLALTETDMETLKLKYPTVLIEKEIFYSLQ